MNKEQQINKKRHCEDRRSEAIQKNEKKQKTGLLRCYAPRNDERLSTV
jgi:hypothetical protein